MSPDYIAMLLGLLLFAFIFLGSLGFIIFRDAKAYGLPALKWALIAVFVPNLIGVVLYLVARSKVEKELYCSNCQAPVENDFNLCPNCAIVFESICPVCKKALKSQYERCPYCGSQVTGESIERRGLKISKKTKLTKNLVILCGVYFIIMIGVFVAILGVSVSGYAMNVNIDDILPTQWETNFSTISIDSSTLEEINHSFHYTTAVKTRKLNVYADEDPQIDLEIALESGEIEIQILNEKQETVFEKTFVGELDAMGKAKVVQSYVPLTLDKDEVYDIKFIYRKAKGGTLKIKG